MILRSLAGVVAALAVPAAAAPAPVAAPEKVERAKPADVEKAIRKGVNFLWSKQKSNGRWENSNQRENDDHTDVEDGKGDVFGGITALSLYALLGCGEKPQDPRMVKSLAFLRDADTRGTYGLAFRCEVWAMVSSEMGRNMLKKDAAKLAGGIQREGLAKGMWDYTSYTAGQNLSGNYDRSNSQYGVLGLWTAAEAGIPIANTDWKLIDQVWRTQQNSDGGWSYVGVSNQSAARASMTAAGIATLLITQDLLPPVTNSWCRGNIIDPQVEKGIHNLAEHWIDINTAYAFYGLERIGAASGHKYIGTKDWYHLGCNALLATQGPAGSWEMGQTDVIDTAFALLFLSHGRAPILINKLDYAAPLVVAPSPARVATSDRQEAEVDRATNEPRPADNSDPTTAPAASPPALAGPLPSAHWNQRPRDVANLTRFTGRNTERMYHWQIVNLNSDIDDLQEAPILFISGNEGFSFRPEEEARLRLFVQQGGMIVANADCPGKNGADDPFSAAIKVLGSRLFNGNFRVLPPQHPLLAEQQYKSTRWGNMPVMEGLSNGVRELMVLLPSDPGVEWHRNNKTSPWAFELGADLCLYATDKENLRFKGETHVVTAPAGSAAFRIRIARLKAGANWNPEPGGWRRMDAILRRSLSVGLTVDALAPENLAPGGYAIAHLTGTTKFQFTDVQRQELSKFVAAGGTLVVDAAGGASAFAESAARELAITFGGDPAEPGQILPLDHPLYKLPSAEIKEVDYRNYARRHAQGKLNVPRIRGIEKNGRVAIFYSREDLSAGMVGESVDGVYGYSPKSATDIMRNIILYTAAQANEKK